jgi:nitrogen fixation NifU-like protein
MAKYSSRVLDYFFNPRNCGEVRNPDGVGHSGGCSERNFMCFTLKVDGNRISDIRFKCYTCPVAVAACSVVTEMARGKNLTEATGISPESVASALEEVPEERMDRCFLAVEALRAALSDFKTKEKAATR